MAKQIPSVRNPSSRENEEFPQISHSLPNTHQTMTKLFHRKTCCFSGHFRGKATWRPYRKKGHAFQKQIGVIKELERPFWGWKGSTSATSCRSVFGGIQPNLLPKERDLSQLEWRHFFVIFTTFIHLSQPLHRINKCKHFFNKKENTTHCHFIKLRRLD